MPTIPCLYKSLAIEKERLSKWWPSMQSFHWYCGKLSKFHLYLGFSLRINGGLGRNATISLFRHVDLNISMRALWPIIKLSEKRSTKIWWKISSCANIGHLQTTVSNSKLSIENWSLPSIHSLFQFSPGGFIIKDTFYVFFQPKQGYLFPQIQPLDCNNILMGFIFNWEPAK